MEMMERKTLRKSSPSSQKGNPSVMISLGVFSSCVKCVFIILRDLREETSGIIKLKRCFVALNSMKPDRHSWEISRGINESERSAESEMDSHHLTRLED